MTGPDAMPDLAAHFASMPPVATMGIRVLGDTGDGVLRLQAPLDRHVNDKGCAFGGSLASLMTLAGWGLATRALGAAGIAADVFVADSDVRYLAPLYDDLCAEARFADGTDVAVVVARLRAGGRARVVVDACVRLPDGGVAARGQARFVAVPTGYDAQDPAPGPER